MAPKKKTYTKTKKSEKTDRLESFMKKGWGMASTAFHEVFDSRLLSNITGRAFRVLDDLEELEEMLLSHDPEEPLDANERRRLLVGISRIRGILETLATVFEVHKMTEVLKGLADALPKSGDVDPELIAKSLVYLEERRKAVSTADIFK